MSFHETITKNCIDTSAQQLCYGETISEGDLTDEYIVSLLYEYGDSSHDTSYYQSLKLSYQMQDILNIAPQVVSDLQRVTNNIHSPEMFPIDTGSSANTLSYPMMSPNFVSMMETPATVITDLSHRVNVHQEPPQQVSLQEGNMSFPRDSLSFPGTSESDVSDFFIPEMAHVSEASNSGSPSMLASPEGSVQGPPKKRRGRKPKPKVVVEEPKAKKIRVYEIEKPFDDRDMERKRRNAVNAKRHRDLQREERECLEQRLADVTIEKDILKHTNEELNSKVARVTQELEMLKRYYGVGTLPSN